MSGERCIFCGSVRSRFWQTWGSYMPQPCQLEAIIEIYQAADGHIHGLLANNGGHSIDSDLMYPLR